MTMINEVLDKFDSEINKLVNDAFNGNGFDYDDFLEMTGQMRNDYSIQFFLQSDLCNDILDYLQEHNEDNDYDVIEAVSAEFAMRLEDKIDESIPYSNRRMIAKENRILNRIARTMNIDEPDSSVSRELMPGYENYINEGYKATITKDEDIGIEGCFGYQFSGAAIDEPYIYLSEVYQLNKNGNNIVYLNEYKYCIDGTLKEKRSKKYDGEAWQTVRNSIKVMHPSIIDDKTTIIPLSSLSYIEAHDEVIKLMKEKNIDFS